MNFEVPYSRNSETRKSPRHDSLYLEADIIGLPPPGYRAAKDCVQMRLTASGVDRVLQAAVCGKCGNRFMDDS